MALADFDTEFSEFEQTILDHEKLIAECVIDEGFSYVAALPSDVHLEKEISRAELGGSEAADPDSMDIPDDPNDEIEKALDDEAREAYNIAYWGDVKHGGSNLGCGRTACYGFESGCAQDNSAAKVDLAVDEMLPNVGVFVDNVFDQDVGLVKAVKDGARLVSKLPQAW